MTLGWVFLLPNLLCEPGDVEHPVRLNDDSKIEAPNAEDFFRVFGLSIPRQNRKSMEKQMMKCSPWVSEAHQNLN